MERAQLSGRDQDRVGQRLSSRDIVAGISVAILVIPQALAYARLAGMPPHVGLYAAAIPPLAAAALASSPYLQTGPVALTSLLTFGALATVAPPGSPEYVKLGALLALVVGLTRVLIGVVRIGYVAYLMSEPVIRGFAAAAAVLIVASQAPAVLGVTPASAGIIGPAVVALLDPASWNPVAMAVGGATVALVLGATRLNPLIPGVPIAAAVGIGAVTLLDAPLDVVGAFHVGLPSFSLALPWSALPRIAVAGVAIALVGFAEVASIARTYANQENQQWDPDRDFMSQGAANLAAGVVGGYPVGGSFSRTALTYSIGARSRWSGAVTGVAVLFFLPFTWIIEPLPTAVLGGIVIAAVAPLLRPGPILVLWRMSRPQFVVAASTFLMTILLSPHVEQAVLLGVLGAVGVHLWQEFQVRLEAHFEGDTLEILPEGVLWFGSAETLRSDILAIVADHPGTTTVNLRLDRYGRIDLTAALVLERLIAQLRAGGLEVSVTGAHPETARMLRIAHPVSRAHARDP